MRHARPASASRRTRVDTGSYQNQVALVARLDGRIVGCVRGLLDGEVCTIRALVVEPERQGQGIGSALLTALESEIGAAQRFDLVTNTNMEAYLVFYERHGYRIYDQTEPIPGIELAHLTKSANSDA